MRRENILCTEYGVRSLGSGARQILRRLSAKACGAAPDAAWVVGWECGSPFWRCSPSRRAGLGRRARSDGGIAGVLGYSALLFCTESASLYEKACPTTAATTAIGERSS